MTNLLLVVPLEEEFRETVKLLPIRDHSVQQHEHVYELQSPSDAFKISAAVLGEPGPTVAAQRSERLIALTRPSLTALTGIAGSLSKDATLGDVVVAEEIDHYLANSKARDADSSAFQLSTSGRHFRTAHPILQALRNFEFAVPQLYAAWRAECASRTGLAEPNLRIGRVAVGDSVGDSQAFGHFLLNQDRKYVALEMESSGVAESAFARAVPVPLLILRGISDHSHGKELLDTESKGQWRRAAAGNAASLLAHLLRWPLFIDSLASQDGDATAHNTHAKDVRDFISRNK